MDSVTIPSGIRTSHTWHEIGVIFQIIEDYGIEFFVELGTYQGGLLALLNFRSQYTDNFRCVSCEIDSGMIHPRVLSELNDLITIVDCQSPEFISMTEDYVTSKHKTIIYCDNGDKIKEAKLYAPILKSGDILLIHDYFLDDYVYDIPDYGKADFPVPEVFAKDVSFLDQDETFERLPNSLLDGTRIIGFQKI